jgi:DNA polymerase III subunit delta'
VAGVTDAFAGVLGQERAVAAMRHHARRPVHAYLFSGPAGSGVREWLRAFTAALQCHDHGCGTCDACRLALTENDADVAVLEREGVQWRVQELQRAEHLARRQPLGAGHTIVVIEDVELAVTSAATLLKILEEPPRRTVFLLTADLLPSSMATVLSRCVEIPFAPITEEVITDYLTAAGVDAVGARAAASASGGDLRRAQVLVRDEALAARLTLWRAVPDRLNGVSARAGEVTTELRAAVDGALAPLSTVQEEEMERLAANARELGLRALPRRREIEDRFRREQRRFRLDDVRFGLSALARVYRERMVEGLELTDDGEGRGRAMARGSIVAISHIEEATRALAGNVDEGLVLGHLMIELSRC